MIELKIDEIVELPDDKLKKMISIYRQVPKTDETKETLDALEAEQRNRSGDV